jgi:hypothetical protein
MNAVDFLELDDTALLADCEVHTYRASGPGGQKRNKTSSAVRLHHRPTGLIAKAEEDRSQHVNRRRALRRLRMTIAIELLGPLAPDDVPSRRFKAAMTNGKLKLRIKDPAALPVIHEIFTVFDDHGASPAKTAKTLGVSTSNLLRILELDDHLWRRANEIRTAHGSAPLKHS